MFHKIKNWLNTPPDTNPDTKSLKISDSILDVWRSMWYRNIRVESINKSVLSLEPPRPLLACPPTTKEPRICFFVSKDALLGTSMLNPDENWNNVVLHLCFVQSVIKMPPKTGGEAKVGGATNDNAPEKQRSIQTRSARAGLQVCLSQDYNCVSSDLCCSFQSVVFTVIWSRRRNITFVLVPRPRYIHQLSLSILLLKFWNSLVRYLLYKVVFRQTWFVISERECVKGSESEAYHTSSSSTCHTRGRGAWHLSPCYDCWWWCYAIHSSVLDGRAQKCSRHEAGRADSGIGSYGLFSIWFCLLVLCFYCTTSFCLMLCSHLCSQIHLCLFYYYYWCIKFCVISKSEFIW